MLESNITNYCATTIVRNFSDLLQNSLRFLTTCPILSSTMIAQRIFGSKQQCLDLVKTIESLRSASRFHRSYIDIPFLFSSEFTIQFFTHEEIISKNTHEAAYYAEIKTLMLSFPFSHPELFNEIILHELRHAAWHTLHIRLSYFRHISVHCDYPLPHNATAVSRIGGILEGGEKNITKLESLLKKESLELLSESQLNHLNTLRTQCSTDPTIQLIYSHEATFSKTTIQRFGLSVGKKITNKSPLYDSRLGPVEIQSINKIQNTELYNVNLKCLDPLHIVVNQVKDTSSAVALRYLDSSYELEMDAYLHTRLPEAILRKFYLQLYQNGKILFQHLYETASFQPQGLLTVYPSFDDLLRDFDGVRINILLHPEETSPFLDCYLYGWAKQYKTNYPHAAKQALLFLTEIEKETGKANLELAQIVFSEKDYFEDIKTSSATKNQPRILLLPFNLPYLVSLINISDVVLFFILCITLWHIGKKITHAVTNYMFGHTAAPKLDKSVVKERFALLKYQVEQFGSAYTPNNSSFWQFEDLPNEITQAQTQDDLQAITEDIKTVEKDLYSACI